MGIVSGRRWIELPFEADALIPCLQHQTNLDTIILMLISGQGILPGTEEGEVATSTSLPSRGDMTLTSVALLRGPAG